MSASENSRLPFHAPVLRSLDLSNCLSYLVIINLLAMISKLQEIHIFLEGRNSKLFDAVCMCHIKRELFSPKKKTVTICGIRFIGHKNMSCFHFICASLKNWFSLEFDLVSP